MKFQIHNQTNINTGHHHIIFFIDLRFIYLLYSFHRVKIKKRCIFLQHSWPFLKDMIHIIKSFNLFNNGISLILF